MVENYDDELVHPSDNTVIIEQCFIVLYLEMTWKTTTFMNTRISEMCIQYTPRLKSGCLGFLN